MHRNKTTHSDVGIVVLMRFWMKLFCLEFLVIIRFYIIIQWNCQKVIGFLWTMINIVIHCIKVWKTFFMLPYKIFLEVVTQGFFFSRIPSIKKNNSQSRLDAFKMGKSSSLPWLLVLINTMILYSCNSFFEKKHTKWHVYVYAPPYP